MRFSTASFGVMNIRNHFAVFTALCMLSVSAWAEPACVFENTGHRRISGDNPKDLQCMKLLAAQGDAFYQYYLGLVHLGRVAGEKNIPEGLALLKTVAQNNNRHSADAMRFLGEFYKSPGSALRDNELAYRWLYLASQQPMFKDISAILPDKELTAVIAPQRMRELEQRAPELLKTR
jgi:hypothetical protein